MLVHPVRREHQQPSLARGNGEPELREAGFAALLDVVQIPEQDEIAVGEMIDCVEMQLETLLPIGTVALQDEVRILRGIRYRGIASPTSRL